MASSSLLLGCASLFNTLGAFLTGSVHSLLRDLPGLDHPNFENVVLATGNLVGMALLYGFQELQATAGWMAVGLFLLLLLFHKPLIVALSNACGSAYFTTRATWSVDVHPAFGFWLAHEFPLSFHVCSSFHEPRVAPLTRSLTVEPGLSAELQSTNLDVCHIRIWAVDVSRLDALRARQRRFHETHETLCFPVSGTNRYFFMEETGLWWMEAVRRLRPDLEVGVQHFLQERDFQLYIASHVAGLAAVAALAGSGAASVSSAVGVETAVGSMCGGDGADTFMQLSEQELHIMRERTRALRMLMPCSLQIPDGAGGQVWISFASYMMRARLPEDPKANKSGDAEGGAAAAAAATVAAGVVHTVVRPVLDTLCLMEHVAAYRLFIHGARDSPVFKRLCALREEARAEHDPNIARRPDAAAGFSHIMAYPPFHDRNAIGASAAARRPLHTMLFKTDEHLQRLNYYLLSVCGERASTTIQVGTRSWGDFANASVVLPASDPYRIKHEGHELRVFVSFSANAGFEYRLVSETRAINEWLLWLESCIRNRNRTVVPTELFRFLVTHFTRAASPSRSAGKKRPAMGDDDSDDDDDDAVGRGDPHFQIHRLRDPKMFMAESLDSIVTAHSEPLRQMAARLADRAFYTQRGLKRKESLLFYGWPGCGKTATILALANETHRHIIELPFALVQQAGDMQQLLDVECVNQTYFCKERLILVLEEIDRDIGVVQKNLGAILTALDGLCNYDGLMIIATCNNAENLPPVIRRDLRLTPMFFGLPKPAMLEAQYRRAFGADAACWDAARAQAHWDARRGPSGARFAQWLKWSASEAELWAHWDAMAPMSPEEWARATTPLE